VMLSSSGFGLPLFAQRIPKSVRSTQPNQVANAILRRPMGGIIDDIIF
jgi:hypothetical protein